MNCFEPDIGYFQFGGVERAHLEWWVFLFFSDVACGDGSEGDDFPGAVVQHGVADGDQVLGVSGLQDQVAGAAGEQAFGGAYNRVGMGDVLEFSVFREA